MARGNPHYLIEEPTTGLYLTGRADGSHQLATAPRATRFATVQRAALYASAERLTEQPHEIVRVDAA